MLHLPSDVKTWLDGIAGAVVGGAATAGSSWMGMLVGKEVGLAVPLRGRNVRKLNRVVL